MKQRLKWIVSVFFMICTLSACAAPGFLYLTPGRYLEPVQAPKGGVVIDLVPFREAFYTEEHVGKHRIGNTLQELRVRAGVLSATLDTLLGDALINKGTIFERTTGWDGTLVGLRARGAGRRRIIGGTIKSLDVQIQTGITRVTSQLEIGMDVDCLIGLSDQQKIVRKTVHMNKKVLRFSANQKAMEAVLDDFLKDAVEQIVKNIDEFI